MTDSVPKKILIVEDEKPMARALKLKLDGSGFQASIAGEGNEVLDILSKETFDLIILDLVIPGIDGFGILAELRNKQITTPVIVASNLGQLEDIHRAKELGAEHYFVKANTSLAQIIELVKTVLNI